MPACGCPMAAMWNDEHPSTTVVREVQEELGLAAHFVWPAPIFLTVTETQGQSAGHTDVSLWYVLHGKAGADFAFDTGEFHALAWFAFDRLPLECTDPHLVRFVAKMQTML
ncbi:MAG: NUDIX hydrolase [Caldilineaceae bacterium]